MRSHRTSTLVAVGALFLLALTVRLMYDNAARNGRRDAAPPGASVPDTEHTQLDFGARLLEQGDAYRARAAFEAAARLSPSDPVPYNWLGTIAVKTNQRGQALDYFHESLKRDPRDPDIWRASGQLFLHFHDFVAAARAYQHVVDLAPGDASGWLGLGLTDRARNLQARGLTELKRAAQLDAANLTAQVDLGKAALEDGKPDVAGSAFGAASRIDPHAPAVLLGNARVILQLDPSPANLDSAGKMLADAMAARPHDADVYEARGQWNLLERRSPAAIADLQHALKLDPSLVTAHIFLSQAYAASGQATLARQESALYLKLYAKGHSGPVAAGRQAQASP